MKPLVIGLFHPLTFSILSSIEHDDSLHLGYLTFSFVYLFTWYTGKSGLGKVGEAQNMTALFWQDKNNALLVLL